MTLARTCYAPGDAVYVTPRQRRIPAIVSSHDDPYGLVAVKYLEPDGQKLGGLFRPEDVSDRECDTCAAMPGTPTLCADCLRVRATANPPAGPQVVPVRHKYRAKKTEVNGRTYASKLEASYAADLALERDVGLVVGWMEQVPLHLKCGARYVLDFLVFYADGHVEAVETKGMETAVYKLKKRMVEQEYPWLPIEVVKRPVKAKKERKR